MSGFRRQVEDGFGFLAQAIYNHPFRTILIVLFFFVATVHRLPDIRVNTAMEGLLHEDDPALVVYDGFRERFGRDELLLVALQPEDVFDPDFLNTLKAMHEEIETHVPHLEKVASLINARNTYGRKDELVVGPLLADWPRNADDIAALRRRVFDTPMYLNLLISEDGYFTTIVIRTRASARGPEDAGVLHGFEDDPFASIKTGTGRQYLTGDQNSAIVSAVDAICDRYRREGLNIYVAGSPATVHFLKTSMLSDMRVFAALALLTIAVLLYIMFRKIAGVVLPLLVVVLSMLSTLGVMAMCGAELKLPTQILPSFILAVGVGDSVHILAIMFMRMKRGDPQKEALVYSLRHSGLAILMTSLTTAAGLLSFATAKIAPVADLGIYAGIGVLLAMAYSIVLLPALLALVSTKRIASENPQGVYAPDAMDRMLTAIGRTATRHNIAVLVITAILIGVSIVGILRIRFAHHPLQWFPEKHPLRVATETIDRELRGSVTLEVLVDTGTENGLHDPDFLRRLDRSVDYIENLEYKDIAIGKAWTITTILKEINRALHGNRPEYYVIPDDRLLVAQELLLFENTGADDLNDVTDSRFQEARFTIKAPFADAVRYRGLLDVVEDHFAAEFPEAAITTTGIITLLLRTIVNVIISMRDSYIIALIVITFLMILLIGKVRIGLLSMIPNLTPILLMLGIIGWLDIPMDMTLMIIGSVAIGLAVDDTVHFFHHFRRFFEECGDPEEAVRRTLLTSGRAMLATTCVLSVGFFIFLFASMQNFFNFGLLSGITIIIALLADYFIAPALMATVNRKKGEG